MCDSLSLTADVYDLQEQFDINKTMVSIERLPYIRPTNDTIVILGRGRERRLVDARWGLFPFWAKDSMRADFNALLGKPAFRRMLTKQRCVIPCSAFHAVRKDGKKERTVRFVPDGGGLFALAGLYEERTDPRGALHRSCTIVTTPSNRLVGDYSSSMPVILEREAVGEWLTPVYEGDADRLRPFAPYDDSRMRIETNIH